MADAVHIPFPIEFLVHGTAVSHQSASAKSRDEWKTRVMAACRAVLPADHWATESKISLRLYYFLNEPMQGDLDNIIKLVVDAMSPHVYLDDRQVDRLVVQKFEPGGVFEFRAPSTVLEDALVRDKPVLYIRVADDPFEGLR